jgi:hypothetical protein
LGQLVNGSYFIYFVFLVGFTVFLATGFLATGFLATGFFAAGFAALLATGK